jgi:SAM-dependent methyltransferase
VKTVNEIADAYSTGAEAWADGPIRIYGTMADLLVARSPIPLRGSRLLDLGTGTGAASRPALAAGARVTAIDRAFGMLQTDRATRPPGVVADAVALPLRRGAFDVVVAAFSLNHLEEPAAGVRQAAAALRPGGFLLASTYATDDDHPAKDAAERALREIGWETPAWYPQMKAATSAWGTPSAAAAAIERGGMEPVSVEHCDLPFPELSPDALIHWRLGMAQSAEFLSGLDGQQRAALARRAAELLGPDPAPLVRSVIFIVARAH